MFGFGKKKEFEEIFSTLISRSGEGIVVVNDKHSIIYYNDSAARIFGFTREEVMNQHLGILLPDRIRLQHDQWMKEFGRSGVPTRNMGTADNHQFAVTRKNGVEFLASAMIHRIEVGEKYFYAAAIRDVSDEKKTEEVLIKLASTDPLTGVFNRREFLQLADQEGHRSQRYGRPLSVMILDIDHFKKLNDTYGHAAGDKALQKFAQVCSNALRSIDIFGRWGGEEFVALLPETDVDGASVIAERLRRMVEESTVVYNETNIKLTCSIGVGQYTSTETSVDAPLGRADQAVYEAKESGRNRVCVTRNS